MLISIDLIKIKDVKPRSCLSRSLAWVKRKLDGVLGSSADLLLSVCPKPCLFCPPLGHVTNPNFQARIVSILRSFKAVNVIRFSLTPLIFLILPCLWKRRNLLFGLWHHYLPVTQGPLWLSCHILRFSKLLFPLFCDNAPLPSACRIAVSFKSGLGNMLVVVHRGTPKQFWGWLPKEINK